MDDPDFPLYRRAVNGLNWYRISSPMLFTEVHRVGSRYVAHQVRALIHPDHVRIADLIAMENGHVVACEALEFEAALAQCGQ